MSQERLQKILAQAGIASRRASEALLTAGRVRVNGNVVRELGSKADPARDKVEVDGKRVVLEKPVYYLVHKPREMVTTLDDPEGRRTLGDMLRRIPQRVYPVGRLDYHTTGALLVTNDGEMAQALMHPRRKVPKTYIAKIKGKVAEPELQAFTNGVILDDGYKTRPATVSVLREERGNNWLQITITEGRNRQIHRMAQAVGKRVMRLHRIAFAGLSVEGMPPETLRPLNAKEVDKLKRDYLNPRKRQIRNEQRAEGVANLETERAKPRAPRSTGRPAKKQAPTRGAKASDGRGKRGSKASSKAARKSAPKAATPKPKRRGDRPASPKSRAAHGKRKNRG